MQDPPNLPGRYRALELLGEGAVGRVWRVEDTQTETVVALRELCGWTADDLTRLRLEFELLRKLQHPNLAATLSLDALPDSGRPFLTYEYVGGGDLVSIARAGGAEVFVQLAFEAVSALGYLHAAGVTHRRIHPPNLLVRTAQGSDARLALLDFGMALRKPLPEHHRPTPHTLPYLAPESLDGVEAGIPGDLYSLGTVLFAALHGRPPVELRRGDVEDFVARVHSGRRARPATPEGYPEGLRDWLEAMLSPDPSARPASAAEALRQLGEACNRKYVLIDAGGETPDSDAEIQRLREESGSEAEEEGPVDRQLTALYGMIRRLNSQNDPDSVLESILDMALEVVRAERGMILLRDEDTEEFNVHLARNLEHETIVDARAFSSGIAARAGTGQSVLSLDALSDDRFRELKSVSLYGIHALMCVPLRIRETIIGTVYVDSREDGLFTPDDLRFLEAFADHAALALANARRRVELVADTERLQAEAAERAGRGNLIGESPQITAVFDLIDKVAASELPVLIQGESGTGKELVARAIHYEGPRAQRPFVSENCAAIPDTLLQSELFGHVRGAFTGADRDRAGLFEQAHEGTLFLDEIGDMSPTMQAQLLRVLQEGDIRRVGGSQPIHVDVRVIAATNRDLQQETDSGRFREDLLYRLQVLLIALPPLRERAGDVRRLVRFFLHRIAGERGKAVQGVEPELLERLERNPWPGNVRQLENTLQRLALLAGEGPLGLDLLALDPGLRKLLDTEPAVVLAGAAPLSLATSERGRIIEALRAADGNRARAARLLGVSRATIYRKIKEFEL